MPSREKNEPLWRISVATNMESEDAVSELLVSLTRLSTATYFDCELQTSTVSVYGAPKAFLPRRKRGDIAAAVVDALNRIKGCGLNLGPARVEVTRIRREDWAESWKKHFKPMVIRAHGDIALTLPAPFDSLLVKPSWSKRRPARRQAEIILDPGLSFGTGQHPTTAFCLHEITRCLISGRARSFLDIGTGSGILAIAAAKLGYVSVEAFDFDPESVRVATQNARKNRVTRRVQPTRQDVTRLPLRPARQFDLVCANLIANLLLAERKRIIARVEPGGTLVLAGILAAEFAQVANAYAMEGMKLCGDRTEKEWRSGAFCFV